MSDDISDFLPAVPRVDNRSEIDIPQKELDEIIIKLDKAGYRIYLIQEIEGWPQRVMDELNEKYVCIPKENWAKIMESVQKSDEIMKRKDELLDQSAEVLNTFQKLCDKYKNMLDEFVNTKKSWGWQ